MKIQRVVRTVYRNSVNTSGALERKSSVDIIHPVVMVVSVYLRNVWFICSNSHDSSFTKGCGCLDRKSF